MSMCAWEKPLPKTQIMAKITGATDLSKKQVAAVVDTLVGEIGANLGRVVPASLPFLGCARLCGSTKMPRGHE